MGVSLAALFELSNGEGWNYILYRIVDSTEPGQVLESAAADANACFFRLSSLMIGVVQPPSYNYNLKLAALVMVFMVISNIVITRLFLSVVVDSYLSQVGSMSGRESLSRSQLSWIKVMGG